MKKKLMTLHMSLHTRDNTDRLCVSRKEGDRRLTCVEECVDASIHGLEEDIKKSIGKLIAAATDSNSKIQINKNKN